MKQTAVIAAFVGVAALAGWATPAAADSAEAMCEVRKDGETKNKQSGPCTFSQRQGYIDLDMRNGETYSLAPGNKPGNFKDQKGNKVTRTQAGGNTQEFKWEGGRKIIVTFNSTPSNYGGGGKSGASGYKDLAGMNSIKAIDEMSARGFRDVDSLNSGNTQYGIFYNPGTRQCIQLTMADGRVVSADDIKTHPKCR